MAPGPIPKVAVTEVERSNQFAARLLKEVARGSSTNTTLSPTSVRLAMSLVTQGAKGTTKSELATALELDAKDAAGEAARELADWKKRGTEGPTVRIANRVFAEKTSPFERAFVEVATKQFGSGVDALDFANQAEPSRTAMNAWVAKETAGKIPTLFPPGSIKPETRYVVANAVYFLGTWKTPFDKSQTTPKPFFVAGGEASKPAPMMRKTAHFGFLEEENASLALLPYQGDTMAMVVVLPKQRAGLSSVLGALEAATLTRWHEGLSSSSRELALELPKFELTAGGSIKDKLSALGIKQAFTEGADFSGMGSGRFAISDVFHKTFIRVDEKGTEAAAATAVVMNKATAVVERGAEFVADHPFLFVLRDESSGMAIFMGRVADPSAAAK